MSSQSSQLKIAESDVSEILSKYEDLEISVNKNNVADFFYSLTEIDPDMVIDKITNSTRSESTGFFKSKSFKLRDELLPYPKVELVFEMKHSYVSGHTDAHKYVSILFPVKISLLSSWLNENSQNSIIYQFLKDDKRFRSKFNPNWILIPHNARIAFALSKELTDLLPKKETIPVTKEVELISF